MDLKFLPKPLWWYQHFLTVSAERIKTKNKKCLWENQNTCILIPRGDSQLGWYQDLSEKCALIKPWSYFEALLLGSVRYAVLGIPTNRCVMNYIKLVCNEYILRIERAPVLTCGRSWLFCRLRSSLAAKTPGWGRQQPSESSCSTAWTERQMETVHHKNVKTLNSQSKTLFYSNIIQ